MHARKLYSWCWHILVTMMAVGIVLFGMVWDVRAQESDPPPTGVPEIVGGAPSTPGEWPWQVALINASASNSNFYNAQFCGGTLIHPQWVLTAAHCITNDSGNVVSVSSVDVVAGIYNLNSPAAGFQRRDVVQIIRHPSYNRANFDNDIALLRLSPVVNIGGSGETATALIPLVPASIGDLAGRSSWATGWGNTESVPQWPQQLHEVQLPILANSICNDAAHYGGMITANMLCAGYDAGGFDACQGDSGGPLVVFDNGQWKLAGVVSFGDGCAEPFSPGIYARVSQYGNWVNGHIGQTSLESPSGSITDYTPTYTWNAVPTMTHYYLWVDGPGGNVLKKWFTAAEAGCGSGTDTCSVTPANSLRGGSHIWWVQTWNPAGYGPWSTGMSFSLPVPAAATLVSPTGSINDETPTYTWNVVSNVTWYYLWVNGPNGNKVKQWYDASLICGGGTCSVTPAVTLSAGNHTWWVQTWSSAGYGPWSNGMGFSIPPSTPVQPTLITPATSTNDLTPTYTWNAVTSETGAPATWYYLWVNGPGGNVIKQWYTHQQAGCMSGMGTCSITPNIALMPGNTYTWWIQPYNSAGYGPWSTGKSFNLTSVGGFNSQFNGSFTGWSQIGGVWSIDGSAWTTTARNSYDGPYSYSIRYDPATYTNLDFSARFYRAGCVWCDNFLYVRGTSTPVNEGYWNSGYQFTYANDGTFSVWKVVGGTWTLVQDYAYTPAITIGGWNTLRVVAAGSNLHFLINNTLVWTGTDTSLASGHVGLGMDNFETVVTGGRDQVWVDWAVLNSYAESMPVITGTVSAEQQALNDAANANGSDKKDGGDHR